MQKNYRNIWIPLIFTICFFLFSCKKYLPENRENVGLDSRFTQTIYEPVLGRKNIFSNNFFKGSTSYPATFTIVNPRRFNGDPAPELTDTFPVKVWNQPYTGDETSLKEIKDKIDTEYHSIWEVRPHSGQFLLWEAGKSGFVRTQPDSGYIFDMKVENSGGRIFFRNLRLRPYRERPYEPSNLDPLTGLSNGSTIHPFTVQRIKGASTDKYLSPGDIDITFHRLGDGNKLTFMFLDSAYHPMDPDNFNLTQWKTLVHGFNMKMTDTTVSYDVVYPIPLTNTKTKYTTLNGERAHVDFSYSRLGFAGVREVGHLGFNFSIYEPGDWLIIFAFKNENPKFQND